MFCWISAAVIALVTLRRGAGPGAWLLMWALLPSGVLLYAFGDSGPLALIVGTTVVALVLRTTVNLSLAVLAGWLKTKVASRVAYIKSPSSAYSSAVVVKIDGRSVGRLSSIALSNADRRCSLARWGSPFFKANLPRES